MWANQNWPAAVSARPASSVALTPKLWSSLRVPNVGRERDRRRRRYERQHRRRGPALDSDEARAEHQSRGERGDRRGRPEAVLLAVRQAEDKGPERHRDEYRARDVEALAALRPSGRQHPADEDEHHRNQRLLRGSPRARSARRGHGP